MFINSKASSIRFFSEDSVDWVLGWRVWRRQNRGYDRESERKDSYHTFL